MFEHDQLGSVGAGGSAGGGVRVGDEEDCVRFLLRTTKVVRVGHEDDHHQHDQDERGHLPGERCSLEGRQRHQRLDGLIIVEGGAIGAGRQDWLGHG